MTTTGSSFIAVTDGKLVIQEYSVEDPAIVVHFKDVPTDDLGIEVDRCLSLGVRVAEVAAPTLNVEFVRREFEDTLGRQKQVLEEGREVLQRDLSAALDPMFGKDGSVPAALRETRDAIERELKKYCDEESARSISATVAKKVEEAVREGERRVERNLAEALDLTDDAKGLGKVYKAIQTEKQTVTEQLAELMAKVSSIVSRREERESSARKGEDFEEDVYLELARVARVYGDSAERTGTLTGQAKRKRGDIVVTIDPALTDGVEVRFTVEAMDRSVGTQKAVLQELDEAKSNRAAVGAIAVLASKDATPAGGQILQRLSETRFICVVDKDDWNPLGLEVAYCWARVDCLKATALVQREEIDLAAMSALIDEAVRHLGDMDRLRTKLSVGRGALNDAEGIISDLEAKLTRCLSRAAAMLA